MTRKLNGTKRNETKATETKQKPNVSHQLDLDEVKVALGKYIKETRGTVMEVIEVRKRGNQMTVAGICQKK